jgi:PAS domain S-box-containing protein
MSDHKRHYVPPKVIRQPADAEYLAFLKNENKTHSEALGGKLSSHWKSHQQYVTVVDHERRYIEVSDDFCKLVGYDRDELLEKKYDDLTASNTNSVEAVYSLFKKLGYMHGLWMLVSREGTRILVRYESWIRSDDLIEGHMEVLGAGY